MPLKTITQRIRPIPLERAFGEFLDLLEIRGDSDANKQNYRARLNSFIIKYGKTHLHNMEPAFADAFILAARRRNLTVTTLAGYTQALQTFERFCRERFPKSVSDVPFSLHLPKLKAQPKAHDKIPTAQEVDTMTAVAVEMMESGNVEMMLKAIIFLWLVETGCRVGETAGLTLDRLGLDNITTVEIDGRLTVIYEALVKGKTGERPVDYTEKLAGYLQAWLAVRPLPYPGHGQDCGRVFTKHGDCGRHWGDPPASCPICGRHGKPITSQVVRSAVKFIKEVAEVDRPITPHCLRHFVGQRTLDMTNAEVARQRLGHADIKTTVRFYGHQDAGRRKRGAAIVTVLGGDSME